MLQKLAPDQIVAHWDEVKRHLRVGLLPFVEGDDEHMQVVLESLMTGVMDLWVIYVLEGEDVVIKGMGTTSFVRDPATLTKNLLIYSLSAYEQVPMDLWKDARESLRAYAKETGCKYILAYSSVKGVVTLAKRLDANVGTTLLSWEV